ncbi:MAG: flagellar filament capping protein FliD [Geminicoccaceae bacterium]|nr:flagellar filament capping protein FliD [Geminicoccaceae bacterium]MCB9943698.1 flagellar filament capping protein FliD [Geminicoccaceae bacterium]
MDSLSFGSLTTTNGSTRLSGTSSKLDTEALVSAAYEAKRIGAVRLETKITKNEAKLTAFGEMKSLLENLKATVAPLRNPPGLLGLKDNMFEQKAAFFTSSSSTSPTDILGVSADNSAQIGSFEITVNKLATANKISSMSTSAVDQTLADAWNGGTAFSGTIELGVAGGSTASINVDGTMDLADLADAINAQTSTTGVRASMLKVSDTDYRMVLTATDTGKAITLNDSSGITGGFNTTELQAAGMAEIEIDGVTVVRESNQIDDLAGGLTINLFKAEPGTKIGVSVESSLANVKEQIGAFVEAYNNFRTFVDNQSTISATGDVAEEAFLYGDRTMRDAMQGLSSLAGGDVAGLSDDALSTLRGIGITMNEANMLEVDDSKLDNALLTRLDEVRNVFEFDFQSSSNDLRVFNRTNDLAATDFSVEITDADNDGVPEKVMIGGVEAEFDGSTIRGPEGSDFAGLELLWAGSGSTTIDVHASQGIADKFYNYLDEVLDPYGGALASAVKNIEDVNDDYQTNIAQIEDRAARARDKLIERFANMEAALSIANTILNQIRTQVDAMTSSN